MYACMNALCIMYLQTKEGFYTFGHLLSRATDRDHHPMCQEERWGAMELHKPPGLHSLGARPWSQE